MLFSKNLPNWERAARVVGGIVIGIVAFGLSDGWLKVVALVVAGGGVISGLSGFCPACAMVGRKLDSRK